MTESDASTDPGANAVRGRVAIVLLAAGSSDRMGSNKMLLDLGGETVLRRAATTAASAEPDLLLVVTGHERERAEAELEGIACRSVFNPDHADGVQTSLRTGVDNLPDDIVVEVFGVRASNGIRAVRVGPLTNSSSTAPDMIMPIPHPVWGPAPHEPFDP